MKALTELKKECINRIYEATNNFYKPYCHSCYNGKVKNLILHHLEYTNNSIVYKNFENSDDGRLKYYSCLLDEIKEDPYNFTVLCGYCHTYLEELLGMTKDQINNLNLKNLSEKDERLIEIYNLTKRKRNQYDQFIQIIKTNPKPQPNDEKSLGLDDFFRS